jgi:hypothetical protein
MLTVCPIHRLIEKGGDWDRRNRLKVYRALHFLSIRNFKEAAELLIDSLSTFTASELMEYDEFVELTVLAASIGCDRAAIKTKVSYAGGHSSHLRSNKPSCSDPWQRGNQRSHAPDACFDHSDKVAVRYEIRRTFRLARRSRAALPDAKPHFGAACSILRPRDACQGLHPDLGIVSVVDNGEDEQGVWCQPELY